jgi:hypothetical protein
MKFVNIRLNLEFPLSMELLVFHFQDVNVKGCRNSDGFKHDAW